MDILGNGLETGEVLDFVHRVTGLLDEGGVGDDAVALVAVTDGDELAVLVLEVVGFGVQLFRDSGIGEVKSEIAPVLNALLVADYEECRRIGLVHFGCESGAVGAGGCGNNLYLYALGFLVLLGKTLKSFVDFGFEVKPVNRTLSAVAL